MLSERRRRRRPVPRFNIEPSISRSKSAKDPSLIFLVFRYGAKDENGAQLRLKYSMRERVLPSYWLPSQQKAKVTAAHPEYADLNLKLSETYNFALQLAKDSPSLSKDNFKRMLDRFLDEESVSENLNPTLLKFWEDHYIAEKEKYKASSTWKKLRQTLNHIRAFSAEIRNTELDFNDIDLNFKDQFENWSRSRLGHSENTISKSLVVIKQMMNIASSKTYIDITGKKVPYHTNPIHTNGSFKLSRIKTSKVFPSLTELNVLLDAYFDSENDNRNKKFAFIRDLYLISAFGGGLRWSDITKLSKDNYYVHPESGEKYLHVYTHKGRNTKSDNEVYIPVNEVLQGLLDKYHFSFPSYSSQEVNRSLKEIFREVGLNRKMIKKSGIKDADPEYVELCDEITFHSARYAYINYMLNDLGVTVEKLMPITGQSYKVLLGYQRADKKKNAAKVHAETKGRFRTMRVIKSGAV